MKPVTEKRYFVTTKFEKYGTYTIMARSKEHAIQMWKDGDWNFDDFEGNSILNSPITSSRISSKVTKPINSPCSFTINPIFS